MKSIVRASRKYDVLCTASFSSKLQKRSRLQKSGEAPNTKWVIDGRTDDAIPVFLEGLQSFRATGAGLRIPYHLAILGDANTRAGRFGVAHRVQEAELNRLAGDCSCAIARGYRCR